MLAIEGGSFVISSSRRLPHRRHSLGGHNARVGALLLRHRGTVNRRRRPALPPRGRRPAGPRAPATPRYLVRRAAPSTGQSYGQDTLRLATARFSKAVSRGGRGTPATAVPLPPRSPLLDGGGPSCRSAIAASDARLRDPEDLGNLRERDPPLRAATMSSRRNSGGTAWARHEPPQQGPEPHTCRGD
jgi:hypothetical protein